MNYKEQMREWLSEHPEATVEQAFEAGYMTSNSNWCRGKVELMKKCMEILKQLTN